MPTCRLSKREELIPLVPVTSNLATTFCVPPPPIVAAPIAVAPPVLAALLAPAPASDGGVASINDDSGLPPNVSASAAFNPYGTLTKSTRDCSTPFGKFTSTPPPPPSPPLN